MSIAAALAAVRASIRASAAASDRDPSSVRLLAVSKGHPSSSIRQAYAAGQRDFGENYVQELVRKAEELADLTDLRWHFIGHLQRNKAKDVVRVARSVHTVDRAELAAELDRRATGSLDGPLDVLLEVNIAREPQKAGCDPDGVPQLLASLGSFARIRPVGLMCIPPAEERAEDARRWFASLAQLRDRCRDAGHRELSELSMGMSHDFDVAVAEGSTWVRVGTAIFGERAPRPQAG